MQPYQLLAEMQWLLDVHRGRQHGGAVKMFSTGGVALNLSRSCMRIRAEGFASSTNSSSTDVVKKQRWLLFLRHCAKCKYNENECTLKVRAGCKHHPGYLLWRPPLASDITGSSSAKLQLPRFCCRLQHASHHVLLPALTMQGQCKFGKHLWNHILTCTVPACAFPRCSNSKELLKHHQKCLVRWYAATATFSYN